MPKELMTRAIKTGNKNLAKGPPTIQHYVVTQVRLYLPGRKKEHKSFWCYSLNVSPTQFRCCQCDSIMRGAFERTGGIVQVEELLPNMCKALGFNLQYCNKKR
jgi:hypothetical protein